MIQETLVEFLTFVSEVLSPLQPCGHELSSISTPSSLSVFGLAKVVGILASSRVGNILLPLFLMVRDSGQLSFSMNLISQFKQGFRRIFQSLL